MGDRASIVFKQGEDRSPILCSHWGGREFQYEARRYAESLIKEKEGKISYPLDRLEVGVVMVDFIRHITKDMKVVNSDLYIARNDYEVDDSDNGCDVIELPKK